MDMHLELVMALTYLVRICSVLQNGPYYFEIYLV